MKFEFLADNKNALPVLANWYFEEWGYLRKGDSPDKVTARLQPYLNTNKIPLILLAFKNTELLGAAQLKFREMDIYPEKEHWLGGVYVPVNHRGKRIAENLINQNTTVASDLGVRQLYLQTQHLDGGLYGRLGWQAVEQVNYHGIDVLVMVKEMARERPDL